MLLGEFRHSIDTKGRFIVPAKFRPILGDVFIITKGLDKCLFVYTMDEWFLLEQKITRLPITDKNARKFVRFFFGGAVDCSPDSQGRILIPQNLRDYAMIKKDIVTIGLSTKIEIWSSENYNVDVMDDELIDSMAKFGV